YRCHSRAGGIPVVPQPGAALGEPAAQQCDTCHEAVVTQWCGGQVMAAVRRERRRLAQDPVIPLAPLIDVVFLLLVFFMLITRFLNPTIDLTLPQSSTAQINDS